MSSIPMSVELYPVQAYQCAGELLQSPTPYLIPFLATTKPNPEASSFLDHCPTLSTQACRYADELLRSPAPYLASSLKLVHFRTSDPV